LIQAGLIQRTPRGRMVTNFAYGHLGLKPINNEAALFENE